MPDAHDPTALLRHAAQAGDRRLVDLITRALDRGPPACPAAGHRAYAKLVLRLGLADRGEYDRRL
jgi:hypothetical protein